METNKPQASVRAARRRVLAGLHVSALPLIPGEQAFAQIWA